MAIAAFNENTSNSTRKQSNSGQQNEFDNGILVTVHAAENNELTDEGESQNSQNSQVTDKSRLSIIGDKSEVSSDSNSDEDWSDNEQNIHDKSFESVQIRPLSPSDLEKENAEMVEGCKQNPYFTNMVMDMVKDTLKSENDGSSPGKLVADKEKGNETNNSQVTMGHIVTTNQVGKSTPDPKQKPNRVKDNAIKSPSDTTIYAPGLIRNRESDESLFPTIQQPNLLNLTPQTNDKSNDVIDKITNFVESVRIETARREEGGSAHDGQGNHGQSQRDVDGGPEQGSTMSAEQEAKQLADQMILNSERFKASVAAPQGKHSECFVNPNDTDQNLLQRV